MNQWISFNRADWTINQTSSMFVRYIQENLVNPTGSVNNSPYQGYDTANTQYNHGLEVSYSKAFTPTLASATKLLGSRYNNAQPLGTQPVSPTLYVNGGSPVTLNGGYINFPATQQTSPGNALPFGGPQNFIEIGEDLAWSKGKHQFTFGGKFLYIKDNRTFGAYEEAVDGLDQCDSGANRCPQELRERRPRMLQVADEPAGRISLLQRRHPAIISRLPPAQSTCRPPRQTSRVPTAIRTALHTLTIRGKSDPKLTLEPWCAVGTLRTAALAEARL